MTCHVCANPTCVNDCQHFPPPALKVGSAEQKLQELLKIADDLTDGCINHDPYGEHTCKYCGGLTRYDFDKTSINHHESCPILKLEQFKQTLK